MGVWVLIRPHSAGEVGVIQRSVDLVLACVLDRCGDGVGFRFIQHSVGVRIQCGLLTLGICVDHNIPTESSGYTVTCDDDCKPSIEERSHTN
jgi:hypothetical protein